MTPVRSLAAIALALALPITLTQVAMSQSTQKSAEIRVVSGGAFKQVLTALLTEYQKEGGGTAEVTYRTVGQHMKLIGSGEETFDVAVLTPESIDTLIKEGKVAAGSRADLAKTGVGVVVKAGTPVPDIGTVEAFKQTLLAAKSVAYIDPAAGGSSGIYVAKLLERLGIAKEVNAKAVLVQGGEVAAHVVAGEAAIGIHQISEILAVKGAVLVGPLPAAIQNFTVYSAGIAAAAPDRAAAGALVRFLSGPHALSILKAKGMESAGS
ncbi:MAG: substrate-binding domain-containing protein [Xanthobacteraceae bacterium]